MKIKKIRLENYQGIKEFEFSPDGKNASVYGDNGTGKTTLYNAFCWLWYGKASTGEKNYSPKTVGSHSLNHVVEIEVERDGEKTVLKKDFHEVYKTKRGSADKLFSGHTTDFYIDDVPVQEKEFQKKLDAICPPDAVKLLTRYNFFLEEMPVTDRRKLLLDMCGDISDEDVIIANEELKGLIDILSNKSIEDCQKIEKAKLKKINDELKTVPARIDEAKKGIPDVSGLDADALKAERKILGAEKTELMAERAAKSGTADAEIRRQIADLETEKATARAFYSNKILESQQEQSRKITVLQTEKAGLGAKRTGILEKKQRCLKSVERMKKDRERLLTEWQTVQAKQWDGDTTCPTCGQELPPEQVEEAKKKFNRQKSEQLEHIQSLGSDCSKDKIEEAEQEAECCDTELRGIAGRILEVDCDLARLEEQRKDATAFEDTEECADFDWKIAELKNRLGSMQEEITEQQKAISDKIEEIDGKIVDADRRLADFALAEKQNSRVTELEERLKQLAAEAEESEYRIHLCELFTQKKAEMLDESINSHFKTLKFRLFKEQINGGIADDCEALIPCGGLLVPFASANNAARINAGLEMIEALSEHFGIEMPVWVDNAESVTKLAETGLQTIRLVVSEADKDLRCEYE